MTEQNRPATETDEAIRASSDTIIVGYIAGRRGNDALALASFLAADTATELVVTLVTPTPSAYAPTHGVVAGVDPIVAEQLEQWKDEALARIPDGVRARGEIRVAASEAEGLMASAEEHGASAIVIGAQATALLRQFTIGTVANTLLHASPVPVALAPGGFAEAGPVRRITAIFGARPGANELIGRAVERAVRRDVPLRLLSLVQVERIEPQRVREVSEQVRAYGGERLAEVSESLLDSGRATVEVIEGADVDDAITRVDWEPGDIAMLGSSRLAQGNRIFLGNKALRILRKVPVPVIVVPRRLDPIVGTETGPETGPQA